MVAERDIPARQWTRTRAFDALAFSGTERWRLSKKNQSCLTVVSVRRRLTYELHGSVQPRQDLLTERVVNGNTQEVGVGDEVGFGTGVTGIQDVGNVVLLHQLLKHQHRGGTAVRTRMKTRWRTGVCEPEWVRVTLLSTSL